MNQARLHPLFAYLGFCFTLIIAVQLSRSIIVDAYSIFGSRLDLLGYILSSIIGIPILAYGAHKKALLTTPVLLITIFFILLIYNIAANSSLEVISIFISRYGIFTWFYFGLIFSLSLDFIRNELILSEKKSVTLIAKMLQISINFVILYVAIKIIADAPSTESYQSVANYSIIMLLISTNFMYISVKQKDRFDRAVFISAVLLSSSLIYSIAIIGSTSVVAFWILAFPAVFVSLFSARNVLTKLIIALIALVFVYAIFGEYILQDLLGNTRVAGLSDGIFSISSVQSRLLLLDYFWQQFQIAPVFGNMEAELQAGFPQGTYIHSLPLSLLTHTGIVGFLLIAAIIAQIYSRKKLYGEDADRGSTLLLNMFAIIIILASAIAFFTWIPFWFYLGFMCTKNYSSANQAEVRS